MNALGLPLTLCAGLVLAGCGGSQPPIGAPGAMPQTSANAHRAAHGKSWMRGDTYGDLIYAVASTEIALLTYPDGVKVGQIKQDRGQYLCSDPTNGNVFVTSDTKVFEYAHGGTTPIATLDAPPSAGFSGCSVNGPHGGSGRRECSQQSE